MLDLAAEVMGADAGRADMVEGYIDDAPAGPFDGATCLLTLHFPQRDERVRTAAGIRAPLTPGPPFAAPPGSFPPGAAERDRAHDRQAAFTVASGHPPHTAGPNSARQVRGGAYRD